MTVYVFDCLNNESKEIKQTNKVIKSKKKKLKNKKKKQSKTEQNQTKQNKTYNIHIIELNRSISKQKITPKGNQ
jgi:hypothetical protein